MSTVAQKYVRRSDALSRIDFNELPRDVVGKFAGLVQEALIRNANSPEGMRPGEFRPVIDVDQNTGAKVKRWIGPESFVKDPLYGYQEPRRVARINAPQLNAIWESRYSRRETSGLW
jgi:hypothetical protein